MTTKRKNLEQKVREKYGRVHGEELKEIVLDKFAPPWGPRYTTSPVRDPTIQNLTPTVLRKLLR